MGYLCENGYGVEQDYVKAIEWYEQAWNLGLLASANQIGVLYKNGGYGIIKDIYEAMTWFKKDKRIKWIPFTQNHYKWSEKLIREFLE